MRAALLVGMVCGRPGAAAAHDLELARFHLERGEGPGRYELVVLLPAVAAVQPSRPLDWPEHCRETASSERTYRGQRRIVIGFECGSPLRPGDVLGTPWGVEGSVFTTRIAAGPEFSIVLAGRRGGVVLPIGHAEQGTRPLGDVAAEYAGLGAFHILEGWDHLAFLLCLCLLIQGAGLVWLVSAFTLGHSLSLGLAYLGYVDVRTMPVEAVIALSVAFMAREALFVPARGSGRRERAPVSPRYMAVVAAFGLLHGLGFASELDDLGVSAGERIAGLLSFNVGVELGQLAFVGVVLAGGALARLLGVHGPTRAAALYGAGAMGIFWFLDRMMELVRLA